MSKQEALNQALRFRLHGIYHWCMSEAENKREAAAREANEQESLACRREALAYENAASEIDRALQAVADSPDERAEREPAPDTFWDEVIADMFAMNKRWMDRMDLAASACPPKDEPMLLSEAYDSTHVFLILTCPHCGIEYRDDLRGPGPLASPCCPQYVLVRTSTTKR